MWAAAENNVQAVKMLIEAGAGINERSHAGFTPLMFAVRAGHIETVRALLDEGADPNDHVRPSEASSTRPYRPGSAPTSGWTAAMRWAWRSLMPTTTSP